VGIQTAIAILVLVAAKVSGPAWSGPARVATDVVGVAAVVAGVAMFAVGARTLGRSFSIWLAPVAPARFVDAGLYRHLRHPICTSQAIFLLGAALMGASPLAVALDVVYAAYLYAFKLTSEEAWLLARYPEYAEYMRRVPYRLIPHIL
jgi:protein-S-isoprenylcysteine O-methyltransferase Ste14